MQDGIHNARTRFELHRAFVRTDAIIRKILSPNPHGRLVGGGHFNTSTPADFFHPFHAGDNASA